MRVGELARATGLTVRTLHYYDEIGLLSPGQRSSGGHRLYNGEDIQRLYRICLLRRLGVPLEQIARALDDPAWSLGAAVHRHLDEVDRQVAAAHRLRSGLQGMVDTLGVDGPLDAQAMLRKACTGTSCRCSASVPVASSGVPTEPSCMPKWKPATG
ncbi:MerR family transcriptional regulator [Dactylosporangium sp. CS-047395]|uniref:MerR family transcriptional regulator n=1 Tax=Dactylosporangium sp. CS-047395 TaxID=3239936 RepID=UPI003D907909